MHTQENSLLDIQHRLLTDKQVAEILGISKSGVWEKVKNEEQFPKPFKLSAKQTRWLLAEVNDFIFSKMQSRTETLH